MNLLLASAATFDDIKGAVERFYGETAVTLTPAGDTTWKIVRDSDAADIEGVSVRYIRMRFIFIKTDGGVDAE